MNDYKIGDIVRLKSLHKPTGTIVDITDETLLNGVALASPMYVIRWNDGESGSVSAHDIEPVAELEDPEPGSIWPYVCDVCGDPIFTTTPDPRDDDVNLHFYHDPDCPNYCRLGDNVAECSCDGMAHPDCCPECCPECEEGELI